MWHMQNEWHVQNTQHIQDTGHTNEVGHNQHMGYTQCELFHNRGFYGFQPYLTNTSCRLPPLTKLRNTLISLLVCNGVHNFVSAKLQHRRTNVEARCQQGAASTRSGGHHPLRSPRFPFPWWSGPCTRRNQRRGWLEGKAINNFSNGMAEGSAACNPTRVLGWASVFDIGNSF